MSDMNLPSSSTSQLNIDQKELQKKMQKTMAPILKAKLTAWCSGQHSLATFLMSALQTFILRNQPVFEDAELSYHDDYIEFKVRVPFIKEELVGEKGSDWFQAYSPFLILYYAVPKIKIEASDPTIRLIATSNAMVFKKIYPNVIIEGITENDEEKVYSCYPWLKKDLKDILKMIDDKIMKCKRVNKPLPSKRCKVLVEGAEDGRETQGQEDR